MNNNILLDRGIILSSGEISKDKINLVAGAITQPFAEMVWVTTGGDMETINRLTDILVSMNTPADRGKLFKIIKMLYGLMLLDAMDSEQATPSLSQAQRLKQFSQRGELNAAVMRAIMSEEKKEVERVTLKSETLRKYFPASYTPKRMEETIIRLLEQWQKQQNRRREAER